MSNNPISNNHPIIRQILWRYRSSLYRVHWQKQTASRLNVTPPAGLSHALDKNPGTDQSELEKLRRIIGKTISTFLKEEIK